MTFRAPRILYLHGFASGPGSKKGVAVEAHFAARGVAVERLNLRVPTFETLSLGAMMRAVDAAIAASAGPVVLFGSSLGGLCAARVAERDERVVGLVLLAPAFRLVERWRQQLGEAAWAKWRDDGSRVFTDYTTDVERPIHYHFVDEAEAIDERSGGWPDVRVPTLIIHGLNDVVVDPVLSRTFAAQRPPGLVRLVEVDDGHELGRSLDVILAEADAFMHTA